MRRSLVPYCYRLATALLIGALSIRFTNISLQALFIHAALPYGQYDLAHINVNTAISSNIVISQVWSVALSVRAYRS